MELGKIENIWWFIILAPAILVLIVGVKKRNSIIDRLKLKEIKTVTINNVFYIIGLGLIVTALLEPRVLSGVEKVKKSGSDVYFLIDISKSMMCSDIKPSRLQKAKESIKEVINGLKGERIGFIPFSSAAFVQMPLTEDYDMAEMFLDTIDSSLISGGGTDIKQAVMLAASSFKASSSKKKKLIIFSDGEELESSINITEISKLAGEGTEIICVGVGTKEGGAVPEIDDYGNASGFKHDESGNIVISKLNEESLKEIAAAGKGSYYLSSFNGVEVDKIVKEIINSDELNGEEKEIKMYKQYYQYFLFIGMIFILVAQFANFKKRSRIKGI